MSRARLDGESRYGERPFSRLGEVVAPGLRGADIVTGSSKECQVSHSCKSLCAKEKLQLNVFLLLLICVLPSAKNDSLVPLLSIFCEVCAVCDFLWCFERLYCPTRAAVKNRM